MNEQNRLELNEQIKRIINKAKRSIAAGIVLAEGEDYDFASSRIYYAVFYGMEAVLLTQKITSSKHAHVISRFNQYFIKTGAFPKEISKAISRLFRERQVGDYGFYIDLSEAEMGESIKLAQGFLDKVETYLIGKGYL